MHQNNFIKYLKFNYRVVLGLIWKLLLWCCLFALIGALLLFAHYCSGEPSYSQVDTIWQYLWHFILDNAPVIGIVSSFIGIVAAFLCLRPQFHVTPRLALSNTNQLKVQICNDYLCTSLTNINVELDFVRYIHDGQSARTKRIPINKNSLSIVYGRLKGVDKCYYTVHTEGGFVWNHKYQFIRCRVAATNGITGIERIKEWMFQEKDMQYGGFDNENFEAQPQTSQIRVFHAIFESIFTATEDSKEYNCAEMQRLSNAALDQIKLLESGDMNELYPSLQDNLDTVALLKEQMQNLSLYYENKKQPSPSNIKERSIIINVIKENAIYLAKQMEKEIHE